MAEVRKLTNVGGDTTGIYLPKTVLEEVGWERGQQVVIDTDGDEVTLRRFDP